MKERIYPMLAARRRYLGLSQRELAARAGLRREKLSRIESQAEDVSFGDLCKLVDALGLDISINERHEVPSFYEGSFSPRPYSLNSAPQSYYINARPAPGVYDGKRYEWRQGVAGGVVDQRLAPQGFKEAGFVSGAKAKIVRKVHR